jgi:hypothetical protein
MSRETLEEKIRHNAPEQAAGYFLVRQRSDGNPVRHPPHGAFRLRPFAAPSGAPFGCYRLYFVRCQADTQAMAPVDAAADLVRIQLVPPDRATVHPADDVVTRFDEPQHDDPGDSNPWDGVPNAVSASIALIGQSAGDQSVPSTIQRESRLFSAVGW